MTISDNIHEDTYHSDSAWSLHDLLALRAKGPRSVQAKKFRDAFPYERKRCFDLGTACHMFLLEGGEQTLDARCAVQPDTYTASEKMTKKLAKELGMPEGVPPGHLCKYDGDKIARLGADGFWYVETEKPWSGNAGACKEWKEAQGERVIITCAERQSVIAMGHRALQNPEVALLLRFGTPELTVRHAAGEACAFAVRSRYDWLARDKNGTPIAIVDYKTVASLGRFPRQVIDFGYHRQAAFYQWMWEVETGDRLPVYLIPQETKGMNRARVYRLTDEYLRMGADANQKDLELVEELMQDVDSDWPMDVEYGILELTPPAWAQSAGWSDDEDDDDEGELL